MCVCVCLVCGDEVHCTAQFEQRLVLNILAKFNSAKILNIREKALGLENIKGKAFLSYCVHCFRAQFLNFETYTRRKLSW